MYCYMYDRARVCACGERARESENHDIAYAIRAGMHPDIIICVPELHILSIMSYIHWCIYTCIYIYTYIYKEREMYI